MFITRQHLTLLGVGSLALFGAACNLSVDLDLDGSGTAQTTIFDLDDFNEVDISSAFTADITVVDGPYSVAVTMDDNLFEHLDIGVENNELEVQMDRGNIDYDVTPEIVISMPELVELDVSGASDVTVDGAEGEKLVIDSSGASNMEINARVARLEIDSSGASNIDYAGVADSVTIDVSGASNIDFTDAAVEAASIELSGASELTFGPVDEVTGSASGASSIAVPDGASISIETSGLSEINRR